VRLFVSSGDLAPLPRGGVAQVTSAKQRVERLGQAREIPASKRRCPARPIAATNRSNGSSSQRRRGSPGSPPGLRAGSQANLCSNHRPEPGCSRSGLPRPAARLALNEISPLRRDCLAPCSRAPVTGHDGEADRRTARSQPSLPSVVLMNPPYSYGIERGHDSRTGARHLRSAWNRLASGGRLVAIMPEWFDLPRFLAGLKGPIALRLNAAIERGFVKQGTGITTRLLVLDKVEAGASPSLLRSAPTFEELCWLILRLPLRKSAAAGTGPCRAQSSLAGSCAVSLVPGSAQFRCRHPSQFVTPPASVIGSLTYQSLETPAPLAEQVGHYLPYRPSRIVIDGAAEHPTPLVESVAMGSIAAPMPEAVPQLPDGLVAKGVLSAAQAETLIYAASAHAAIFPVGSSPRTRAVRSRHRRRQTYRRAISLGMELAPGRAGRSRASSSTAGCAANAAISGFRRTRHCSKMPAATGRARRPADRRPAARPWKLGTPIAMREGILFVTYPTLRSGETMRPGSTRSSPGPGMTSTA
jgi:hypothetical protein